MKLSAAELIRRIRDSRLVRDERLERWLDTTRPDLNAPDARQLAYFMVQSRLISRFQMARLIKGKPVVIGNIILEELIGAGGMGTVYRARHARMDRQVAIKILNPTTSRDKHQVKRFQREVQAVAKLSHPNIVTAYDADEQDDSFYLVMEYVDGRDLATLVDQHGPFNVAKAIGCIVQTAKGLQYAHAQGVVHRDIKPSNLLLDKSGVLKILDMGLARIEDRTREEDRPHDSESDETGLTGEHQIIGTVDYMSPEQADDSQSVDERTDMYSLGCTLFFLLTGVSPFYRSTILKTLLAHRTEPIPRLEDYRDDIPDGLSKILTRMMAKEPNDRFASMSELIRQLSPYDDDTDFHLIESVEFSIMAEDDSETRSFDVEELHIGGPDPSSSALSPLTPARDGTSTSTRVEPAVGIDLGTTFSVIAHLDAQGRPQTISNAEGELLTPSVVLIGRDEVVVGKEAAKALATESESVAEGVKRELGQRAFPKRLAGRSIPPEVLLGWILKKLGDDARAKIGPFRHAVITVPAYFDEVRRQATYQAGRLAGIEVLDVMNEPTAAALAFANERAAQTLTTTPDSEPSQPIRCLVYDLGGGTFDVTVMELSGTAYRTLATDGDMRLGGRDWDERLVEWVAARFQEQFGVDPRKSPNALARLTRECEDAKRTLTARRRTTLVYEHGGHSLTLEVTRDQFEELTQDLLARTEFTTRETLSQAKLDWEQIDHVLMVGGATRMPAVAAMLEKLSGRTPERTLSPDESVAKGAALRAGAMLATQRGDQAEFQITNVNSHSLGVVGRSPKSGTRQVAFLIPRNTPLPAQASRTFRTQKAGQRSILVQIVEGESKQPDDCAQVGRCMVHGLPENLPAQTPVQVTFAYDENGRLDVELQVHQTQLRQIIQRPNSLSDEQLTHWQHWLDSGHLKIDEAHLLDLE